MNLLLAFVAILCGIVDAGVSMSSPYYCYSTDITLPQSQMHSVRTSYEAIRDRSVNIAASSCRPLKFWYVGRHGGRYPGVALAQRMLTFADSTIQTDIIRNADAGRTTLCRQYLELIANWVRHPNVTTDGLLATPAGWITMGNIARRYQAAFPHLLPNVYNPNQILFRHTFHPFVAMSLRGFVDGLYGDNSWPSVNFEPIPEVDWFLFSEGNCPEFTNITAARPSRDAFERGPEIEEMLDEVNKRLGFRGSSQLSFATVFTMWEWCRFETASTFELSSSPRGEISAWCSPFSIAHHALLEYHQDLHYYYFTGYGVPNERLVANLACGVIQDLLLFFNSTDTTQTARVYTSGYTAKFMWVALGAFRDSQPLHEHNFAQQTFRQWRMSTLLPNAGHLVAGLYDCGDEERDVAFLSNEIPVIVPGCDLVTGFCKMKFLINKFQRFLEANCATFHCSSN